MSLLRIFSVALIECPSLHMLNHPGIYIVCIASQARFIRVAEWFIADKVDPVIGNYQESLTISSLHETYL